MRLAAALVLLLWAASPVPAQQPEAPTQPDPVGEWLVAKKVARIKIADCDGKLWGVVSWEAQPGVDTKNSNDQLRGRQTLGMPVLLGLRQTGSNTWEGKIYNSQDGHTYAATVSMHGQDTLRVEGCFLELLCGGENWTRVEPEPQAGAPQAADHNAVPTTEADPVCSSVPGAARPPH